MLPNQIEMMGSFPILNLLRAHFVQYCWDEAGPVAGVIKIRNVIVNIFSFLQVPAKLIHSILRSLYVHHFPPTLILSGLSPCLLKQKQQEQDLLDSPTMKLTILSSNSRSCYPFLIKGAGRPGYATLFFLSFFLPFFSHFLFLIILSLSILPFCIQR